MKILIFPYSRSAGYTKTKTTVFAAFAKGRISQTGRQGMDVFVLETSFRLVSRHILCEARLTDARWTDVSAGTRGRGPASAQIATDLVPLPYPSILVFIVRQSLLNIILVFILRQSFLIILVFILRPSFPILIRSLRGDQSNVGKEKRLDGLCEDFFQARP